MIPVPQPDASLVRARYVADTLPAPFAASVHTWINVLCGEASRPSRPLASSTIYHYVLRARTALDGWAQAGIDDLRSVTREDIDGVLSPLRVAAAKSIRSALRSLFRALKRERLIFQDPARNVSLSVARPLPVPLATDLLRGVLDTTSDPRVRLCLALSAIHALGAGDQRALRLDSLDRAHGRLVVRPGHTHLPG
ncbi:hypothetical protein [Streptomyces sp. DB-54]